MTWTKNAKVKCLRLREEWPGSGGSGYSLPAAPIPSNLAQGASARLLLQMLPGPREMEGWWPGSPLEPALLPGSCVLAPEEEGGRVNSCKLFRSQLS